MSTDINRIAELAKEDPKRQFYSIAHLITGEKLHEAFRRLRKDASAGIDGVTYEQYEAHVEENIRQLHRRLKPMCQHWPAIFWPGYTGRGTVPRVAPPK